MNEHSIEAEQWKELGYAKGIYHEKQRVLDILHGELRGIKRVIVQLRVTEHDEAKMNAFTGRAAYIQRIINMVNGKTDELQDN
jgi:hypothetical protein